MVGPMVVNPMVQPVLYPNVYGAYNVPQVMIQQATQPVQHSLVAQQSIESNPTDLQTLKEMCPEMDSDIIKTVLQQCGGNVDRAATQLLEMNAS